MNESDLRSDVHYLGSSDKDMNESDLRSENKA